MKKQLAVLAIVFTLFSVMFIGCRAANKVPGVSAVSSAVGSAVASVVPSLSPTAGGTIMPTATVSGIVTATATK